MPGNTGVKEIKTDIRYPFVSKKVVAVVHINSKAEINKYMRILPRLTELDISYDSFTLALRYLINNFPGVDIEKVSQ